jgi:hypothetical protein
MRELAERMERIERKISTFARSAYVTFGRKFCLRARAASALYSPYTSLELDREGVHRVGSSYTGIGVRHGSVCFITYEDRRKYAYVGRVFGTATWAPLYVRACVGGIHYKLPATVVRIY